MTQWAVFVALVCAGCTSHSPSQSASFRSYGAKGDEDFLNLVNTFFAHKNWGDLHDKDVILRGMALARSEVKTKQSVADAVGHLSARLLSDLELTKVRHVHIDLPEDLLPFLAAMRVMTSGDVTNAVALLVRLGRYHHVVQEFETALQLCQTLLERSDCAQDAMDVVQARWIVLWHIHSLDSRDLSLLRPRTRMFNFEEATITPHSDPAADAVSYAEFHDRVLQFLAGGSARSVS